MAQANASEPLAKGVPGQGDMLFSHAGLGPYSSLATANIETRAIKREALLMRLEAAAILTEHDFIARQLATDEMQSNVLYAHFRYGQADYFLQWEALVHQYMAQLLLQRGPPKQMLDGATGRPIQPFCGCDAEVASSDVSQVGKLLDPYITSQQQAVGRHKQYVSNQNRQILPPQFPNQWGRFSGSMVNERSSTEDRSA